MFTRDRDGDWDIYVKDADGWNAHPLTEDVETNEMISLPIGKWEESFPASHTCCTQSA